MDEEDGDEPGPSGIPTISWLQNEEDAVIISMSNKSQESLSRAYKHYRSNRKRPLNFGQYVSCKRKMKDDNDRGEEVSEHDELGGKKRRRLNKIEVAVRSEVGDFIKNQYEMTEEIEKETDPESIYEYFLFRNSDRYLTYDYFAKLLTRISGVKIMRRGANRATKINFTPATAPCCKFHQDRISLDTTYYSGKSPHGEIHSIKSSTPNILDNRVKNITEKSCPLEILEDQVDENTKNKSPLEIPENHVEENTEASSHPIILENHLDNDYTEQTGNNTEKIHIAMANIRGLITKKRNKCKFLWDTTREDNCKHQIIILTESWTKGNYEKEILRHFPGYNIRKIDRSYDPEKNDPNQLKTGGGTLVLTSEDIPITPTGQSFSNGNCEVCIVELKTINTLLISMYRPSGKNFSFVKYSEAMTRIRTYLQTNEDQHKEKHILLAGDFNFPPKIVTWKDSQLGLIPDFSGGQSEQMKAFEQLLEIVEENNMEQMVNQPTRGKNILDLIFTNQPHLFKECSTSNIKPQSDHNLINFKMSAPKDFRTMKDPQPTIPTPQIATFNFKEADDTTFKEKLKEVDWKTTLEVGEGEGKKIETLAERFTQKIVDIAIEAKVPRYKEKNVSGAGTKYHQKIVDKRRKLIRQSNQLHCREADRVDLQKKIEDLNMKIQKSNEDERKKIEDKVIKDMKTNTQAFFKYANKNRRQQTRVGPLKQGNKYYGGSPEMARILSDQYKSVFSEPLTTYANENYSTNSYPKMKEITLDRRMFEDAMKEIKPQSAPGPDGVPAYLYHNYADILSTPLHLIWNISLEHSTMPEPTLLAYITPILKDIDRSAAENYRPVALTNHLIKIFERVLRKHIMDHLITNDIMNKSQHGFKEKHSTITQLLAYLDSVYTILEEGCNVETIYLDFSKAFDKVDHHILLKKIENVGIQGKTLDWIKSFLTNRQQQVRVGNSLSDKVWVKSGVPQGSVLGPLLFLIMMLDINKNIQHSQLSSYADDTRLWRKIINESDKDLLEQDLKILYTWAEINNAKFNGKKFEGMANIMNNVTIGQYMSPDNLPIEMKETIKDLGVNISADLSFTEHIKITVKETQKIAAWTLRTFNTRSKEVLKTLLQSLIIPKIEYASIIWCPFDPKLINLIENVQQRYTSKVQEYQIWNEDRLTYDCSLNYWERLKDLNIYSLQRRRERFIIMYMYRILIGLAAYDGFEIQVGRGITFKTKYKHNSKKLVKRARHASFFYKGPQLYNLLPLELRQAEEISTPTQNHVNSFKRKVDNFLRNIPDQPNVPDLNSSRVAANNSLICQIPLYRRQNKI